MFAWQYCYNFSYNLSFGSRYLFAYAFMSYPPYRQRECDIIVRHGGLWSTFNKSLIIYFSSYNISIMKKINESFVCIWCKKEIWLASKTCRNHCPYCFTSLHVDGEIPGDRSTTCYGIMVPIEFIYHTKNSKILFLCTSCWKKHRNKVAEDDEIGNLKLSIVY